MAKRHRRRAVAIVTRVPQVIVAIVAWQDIASLADLSVPRVAPGAGEDRVFSNWLPAGETPGRRGLLW